MSRRYTLFWSVSDFEHTEKQCSFWNRESSVIPFTSVFRHDLDEWRSELAPLSVERPFADLYFLEFWNVMVVESGEDLRLAHSFTVNVSEVLHHAIRVDGAPSTVAYQGLCLLKVIYEPVFIFCGLIHL